QDVIHIQVFMKNDNRTIYNLIYRDGKNGKVMVKRFAVPGVTRDKEYKMTKGTPGTKVLYFSANPNGEAEVVRVDLKPKPRIKKSSFDFDFAVLAIKGRNSIGNILTKYAVRKIEIRQEGISTLGSLNIWYDETVMRLNTEERGVLLGAFSGTDRIILFTRSGHYRFTSFDLSTHFDEDLFRIEKYDPQRIYTIIYQDAKTKIYYIKRFIPELTEKRLEFIENAYQFISLSVDIHPRLQIFFDMKLKSKGAEEEEIHVEEFIGIKGYKAKGKRLTSYPVKKLIWLEEADASEQLAVGSEQLASGSEGEEEVREEERKEEEVKVEKEINKRGRKPAQLTSTPQPESQNPPPMAGDEQLELEL
ncbi:MAG: DNA gyrase/topoisomerase IV subunit A, partial [Bacteroidales bacterium]|nr:DNA gyrase/topoisomerase IV subunit A [Bacteroidales bacterium]